MPWVIIPRRSALLTGGMFVVFVLDMVKPGYRQFALIPELKPQIATLTSDVRSDVENLLREVSSPAQTKQASSKRTNKLSPSNCQTLLDGYKPEKQCHFAPTNYLNISP
ncbi:hypothetical protein CAL7716_104890 (plasmid) [Calothrix sp. PCC 7716]|nr:hypothetical protein CAL7716_104890 [Calothrix sp. PCC 7716]